MKSGWIIGVGVGGGEGGGAKGMSNLFQIIGGGGLIPPSLPTPMPFIYLLVK